VAADDAGPRFGIAANIEFPLPASFIWDMFVRVLKDIPGESAFSKQSMSWKLMTLLPQHLEGRFYPAAPLSER
jgi:exodeoxyribonuclease V gamma subunit